MANAITSREEERGRKEDRKRNERKGGGKKERAFGLGTSEFIVFLLDANYRFHIIEMYL